ncbi:MAG: lysophospholipid acyltransferase family protein [Patescibacteria group bacterium]
MRYSTTKIILKPLFRPKFKEINGLSNLPQNGSFILAANHIDYLDGYFISFGLEIRKKLDIYFLSKTKNYWWAGSTLPIDPQDREKSLRQAVNYLQQGKIICNFIEGKRNPEKYLLEGRTGTARMALKARVPVIPVGITCPINRTFPGALASLLTHNHQAIINIGQPISFEKYYGQDITKPLLIELTREVMKKISPLCGKAYSF